MLECSMKARHTKASDPLSIALASGATAKTLRYFAVNPEGTPHMRAAGLARRSPRAELDRLLALELRAGVPDPFAVDFRRPARKINIRLRPWAGQTQSAQRHVRRAVPRQYCSYSPVRGGFGADLKWPAPPAAGRGRAPTTALRGRESADPESSHPSGLRTCCALVSRQCGGGGESHAPSGRCLLAHAESPVPGR